MNGEKDKIMRKILAAALKRIYFPLYAARTLLNGSFIKRSGWLQSYKIGAALDADGKPIPWISYPSLFFLSKRLPRNSRVFEFGSGNSTLWLASLGCSVTSVEHDRSWFEIVKSKIPSDVLLIYEDLEYNGRYSQSVSKQEGVFDFVIVDGRDRVNCALRAAEKLSASGCILWDDSDRDEYQIGIEALLSQGFRKLDFVGLSPIYPTEKMTSIFYKQENIFGV